ncbi:MAG: hypothetical protein CMN76_10015 [Spirochaetaceae bacterium]|nr:hypothetical protein [Spirochaetaceae bacterium]|tara:strand:+ start:22023 stop:22517 length:495 start_codon:yes stop_codon:yes gene_type:complete
MPFFRSGLPASLVLALALFLSQSSCIIIPSRDPDAERGLFWCPPLPNCASTESFVPYLHGVDPFVLTMPLEQAWPIVLETVREMERTEIQQTYEGYIYAKAYSRVFHFIDYFEVLALPDENRLSVRSSAMLGITDFWVNYRRVERLRDALIEKGVIEAVYSQAR